MIEYNTVFIKLISLQLACTAALQATYGPGHTPALGPFFMSAVGSLDYDVSIRLDLGRFE